MHEKALSLSLEPAEADVVCRSPAFFTRLHHAPLICADVGRIILGEKEPERYLVEDPKSGDNATSGKRNMSGER
jgi:hypothetical protein